MANLDKDAVIAAFTEAYKKANGNAPSIESKSGWYSVDGGKNMRLAQLQEMTESLTNGSSVSAEKKEAKAKAKPVKKKTSKASKPGFSVKDFWAEKLKAEAPGATLPR
ncbi:hypothetical protein E5672_06755 [Alteromonas portus]|uniref:Uncharacterized protein n=1 Tax=Alteromonas portus TaxID=2565549 RepID=A0A4U0ZKV7_9ALTE|nr:hypothetical protein [Alteromonas portus]TKB03778.1 hypothetical protein E5672_06755 [Alteromonas portus]